MEYAIKRITAAVKVAVGLPLLGLWFVVLMLVCLMVRGIDAVLCLGGGRHAG